MKKVFLYIAGGLMLVASVPVQAQNIQGYVMTRFDSYTSELPGLSALDHSFGTARSSAMGGAFASLGADLSTMSINPAGLGMYRSSEFGFTPGLTISDHSNSGPSTWNGVSNNSTGFKINNMGIALNLYEGSGPLTSFTFGFGYNRLADFNYNSQFALEPGLISIGDVFVNQLRGKHYNDLSQNKPWDGRFSPAEWGAILSYKTYWAEVDEPAYDDRYYLKGLVRDPENDIYTDVHYYMKTKSVGEIGEYSLAGGFNFGSKFYLGFSLGIHQIYRKQTDSYAEQYANTVQDENLLTGMEYNQFTRISGSGVNFKVGVIANPVPGLRLGLAFHSPTWNSIQKHYSANMIAEYQSGVAPVVTSGTWETGYEYDYSTQPRLLTGISYAFGTIGLIAVDYECAWYNAMRLKVPEPDNYGAGLNTTWQDYFKEAIKNDYKARNTVRVGGELKPVPELSLRAGYTYNGSFLRNDKAVFNDILAYKSTNISAGVGYRITPDMSLDLAYVYTATDYTDYDLFYYDGQNNAGQDQLTMFEYTVKPELKRHNIILSASVRF